MSARYFKQVILIREKNGIISQLRAKGHNIETSVERNAWGFSRHRIAPTTAPLLQAPVEASLLPRLQY